MGFGLSMRCPGVHQFLNLLCNHQDGWFSMRFPEIHQFLDHIHNQWNRGFSMSCRLIHQFINHILWNCGYLNKSKGCRILTFWNELEDNLLIYSWRSKPSFSRMIIPWMLIFVLFVRQSSRGSRGWRH